MAYTLTPEVKRALLNGKRKNANYARAKELSDDMLLLTEGKGALAKLKQYRPSEPAEVREYRLKNFRLITKSPFSKVRNSLAKIGRADDFKISYKEETGRLPKEKFKYYCEEAFPYFDSVTNWMFSFALKTMLPEPNGWVCVLPQKWEWSANEIAKPFTYIYRAEQVLDWSENEYVFILTDETVEIKVDSSGATRLGKVFLFVSDTVLIRFEETNAKDGNDEIVYTEIELAHTGNKLPAFPLGGVILNVSNGRIYESFIAGAGPYWTEALINHSDKQGSIKRHAYPESATWGSDNCEKCSGRGEYINHGAAYGAEQVKQCAECAGTGKVSGPHQEMTVRPGKVNEQQAPWPPKVYIQKDMAPLEFLDKDIDASIHKGYAALNMDFLDQVPLPQSGIAKQYDREELNSFLYDVARHIVENILKPAFYFCAGWRYDWNEAAMNSVLPELTVPEHFDIASLAALEVEINNAKIAGVDARILTALNAKYAEKRFRADPMTVTLIRLAMELDPLAGKSEDEKLTVISAKGITQEEYILSANIETFLRLSIEEDEKFPMLDYSKQRELLLKRASDLKKEIDKMTVPVIPPAPVV